MKKAMFWAATALFFIAIISACSAYNNVDGRLAQITANPDAEDIADTTGEVIAYMQANGITSGNVNIIPLDASQEVGPKLKALINIHEQAKNLAAMETTSVEYTNAVDNLNDNLRDIVVEAGWYVFWRSIFLWMALIDWAILIWLAYTDSKNDPWSNIGQTATAQSPYDFTRRR